ncbi:sigma-70 family RNA polymerase sigma factor [Aeoliella sp. ICT_H6.2]|uniref:Sigma-70 family RNA polymerase sigma factor n=1 Tax=Aeoliella straminimaris TaxID=2954799 RepID=A0A9X2F528_9BACT|nr:sigma-70 family RNA polymerase sigma factor [Aeoliella straminimaris]MCO6042330.1 sigma-70 family RNA polymerase sigma factor [Aeoliella straminimaris]
MRELNVLWTQSHGAVLSYIRSIVVDFHRADDVLQETAATVAEKFDEYDRTLPFAPWALGIAKFKVLEYLRSSSRDRLVFSEEVAESIAGAFSELQIKASDTEIALEQCVSRVRGRPRKLLEMRYLRQTSVEDVAQATGMTSTAVRVALHRIRKSLLQCLQDQLPGLYGGNHLPRGRQ